MAQGAINHISKTKTNSLETAQEREEEQLTPFAFWKECLSPSFCRYVFAFLCFTFTSESSRSMHRLKVNMAGSLHIKPSLHFSSYSGTFQARSSAGSGNQTNLQHLKDSHFCCILGWLPDKSLQFSKDIVLHNCYWEENDFLKTEISMPIGSARAEAPEEWQLLLSGCGNRQTYFVMTAYASCSHSSPVLKEQNQASQRNPPSKQISLSSPSCQNRSPISLTYVMMPSSHDSAWILYWKCIYLQALIASQKAPMHTPIHAILASCHSNWKFVNKRNHLLMLCFSFTLCLAC